MGLACCALALQAAPSAGAAPEWLAPVQLSSAGQNAGNPQIAIAARGDAVALWEGEDNGIQAAFRPAFGGVWQAPVVLSQGVGAVGEADIAVNPAGDAVVAAWPRGNTVEIAEGSANNRLWQMPVTLPIAGQEADDVHVSVDARGDAIAAWKSAEMDSSTVDFTVHERFQTTYRSAADPSWQAPAVVPDAAAQREGGFWTALDSQGDALAVWVQASRGTWTVEASSRPAAGGEWRAPVPISGAWPMAYLRETPGPIMLGAQVAFDARGDAVAVWEHYMQGNWFIEAAIRPAGSETWQLPVRLSTSGLGGARPDLALDEQGDAVVVWEGATATQRTIEAAAGSVASGVWRAPVRLAAWHHLTEHYLPWIRPAGYHATPAAKPRVAVDAHGDAVAVWERAASYYSGVVQAARMSAGSDVWQAPVDVAAASSEGLSVALDERGEAISAWSRIVDEGPDAVEVSALAKLAITRARLSNRRFRVAPRRGRRSAGGSTGTSFYFTLSEPAEVKIAITHDAPGVRSYDGCVAPGANVRRRRPSGPCVRRVTLVTLKRAHEPAGFDSVHFDGRIAHHALSPGTYRALITAGTAGARSAPVALSFTVVR